MKERLLVGLYGLSDPRVIYLAVALIGVALAALALLGAVLPAYPGGLLAPESGGTSNC